MPIKIPLAKGDYLTESGYSVTQNAAQRRKKLIRAVNKHSYKDIVLRLNAVAIRLKNTYPITSVKLKNDMQYLKNVFRNN